MPDIYGILNVGRDALLTHQRAIDVTGHNIANANTPGYSRQRVNLVANEPISFNPGQVGTGVKAEEIQRIHDRFLGIQLNYESQSFGRWEARKGTLDRVEMILDEASGYGLNQAMSDFWQGVAVSRLGSPPSPLMMNISCIPSSTIPIPSTL